MPVLLRDQGGISRRGEGWPAPGGTVGQPFSPQGLVKRLQAHGNAAVARMLGERILARFVSDRFGGDATLAAIAEANAPPLKLGDSGIGVVKLQQALVDLGFWCPHLDGKFDATTREALILYQGTRGGGGAETGQLDANTLRLLDQDFAKRKEYAADAAVDPADPRKGIHGLTADEKTAVTAAEVPTYVGTGGAPKPFQDVVGGKQYAEEIRARLTSEIDGGYADFKKIEQAHKDPSKLYDWSAVEGPANGAKKVVDGIYAGQLPGGAPAAPKAPSHGQGNLEDLFEAEKAEWEGLSEQDEIERSKWKVEYLINSNCKDINDRHNAAPTAAAESALLAPVITSFIDTKAKREKIRGVERAWPAEELERVVRIQRVKQDTDAKNRKQMWVLFHTFIHEYFHACTHPGYLKYANSLDSTRQNTLVEGMTDFFTVNVRKNMTVDDALKKQVEGAYYDEKSPVPTNLDVGVYPSMSQAEQVVSIVGVHNAQAAYFRGEVDKLGGPAAAGGP